MHKFWPSIVLLFVAIINTICVILGNLLTTLLYNGAVSDRWNVVTWIFDLPRDV